MDDPRPDFLILGAPKAGTTALHAALAQHPQVFMSTPKEPKYFLCGDAPPPHWVGPGDAHSQQEWIWREDLYRGLFAGAAPGQVRGESTPFYLWSHAAQDRIAREVPDARLIAVVRDPVDRAYSNWMHLWSDGLEPVGDFVEAFGLQDERTRRGWAPFWRYRGLGLYGEQLARLTTLVDPERVLVVRYRELVDRPAEVLDRTCAFLGLEPGLVDSIPSSNSRGFLPPGWRPRLWGPVIRAGARAGAHAAPEVWRTLHPPLVRAMHGGEERHRPHLSPEQRAAILPAFLDDIALLESVVGDDYSAWRSTQSRGSFRQRVPADPADGGTRVAVS